MSEIDYREVVWENVAALMRYHWGRENLLKLGTDSGISPGGAARLKKKETHVQINTLEKVASLWQLQPWHLLIPHLDPANPPVLYLTRAEAALYERLAESAKSVTSRT
jgi:hypothetical protein